MFGVAVVRRVHVDCSMFCCVFGLGEFPREKLQCFVFNASAMFMWLVHVVLPYEFFFMRGVEVVLGVQRFRHAHAACS